MLHLGSPRPSARHTLKARLAKLSASCAKTLKSPQSGCTTFVRPGPATHSRQAWTSRWFQDGSGIETCASPCWCTSAPSKPNIAKRPSERMRSTDRTLNPPRKSLMSKPNPQNHRSNLEPQKHCPKKLLPPTCHQGQKSENHQNKETSSETRFSFGGAEGIRTLDLLNAIQTRSQLRHSPKLEKSSMKILDMQVVSRLGGASQVRTRAGSSCIHE
jgi:hypothetical protein